MAKTTDLKSVQAALDRAAEKAVHGPRAARSGRFVVSKTAKQAAASALTQRSQKRK
ncbi:MAG TPA: hypothetical protein PLS69_04960 [Terricaulis sp.]|nr:hypothetical protein [Terricaulis sp.]HRP10549.1 hypothetical protein [Terricaulis sp.]